eukprot:4888176-Prymnesium_polylepis.2
MLAKSRARTPCVCERDPEVTGPVGDVERSIQRRAVQQRDGRPGCMWPGGQVAMAIARRPIAQDERPIKEQRIVTKGEPLLSSAVRWHWRLWWR